MNAPSALYSSKFCTIYAKLLQGWSPQEISPNEPNFWSSLLSLDVNTSFLRLELQKLDKDVCFSLKLTFNALFETCLSCMWFPAPPNDLKRVHAVQTLSVLVRCVLGKGLSGWEVMELFSGGVGDSDAIFERFTEIIEEVLCDEDLEAEYRQQVLQLAVCFMGTIGQLSPGAYFLRRPLFHAIATFVKSAATSCFTFEALLLLALLSNFHKSDAAKLNPYLSEVKSSVDSELMQKIMWATTSAIGTVIKDYQPVPQNTPKTVLSAVSSLFSSFRTDVSAVKVDIPREVLQNKPIEASIALLSVFDFTRMNKTFVSLLCDEVVACTSTAPSRPLLVLSVVSLSSYLFTHASTSSSPRALAYANLALSLLLEFVEKDALLWALCQPSLETVSLCRQRLPLLPFSSTPLIPVTAILDCCVLWLRNNLHIRLEVASYSTCISACHRIVWLLQLQSTRLVYHWNELWSALVGLLDFLASKLESLATTGGVEQLAQATLSLLDLVITKADSFLPTPKAVHECVYELVRSAHVLRKQALLLKPLALPMRRSSQWRPEQSADKLTRLLSVVQFYEKQVAAAGATSVRSAMQVILKEIDKDGIHGVANAESTVELPKNGDDVVHRYVCMDALALVP